MTGSRAIRVIVVDDVEELVEAFVDALNAYVDIEVIASAMNGADAVRLATTLQPDIVLMDIRMPVMDGIKATAQITKAGVPTKILMMSAYDDESLIDEAISAGADGYLVKGTLVADTVAAIRSRMPGRPRTRPA
jgi:DNA-binding NarL/FixJ family response regulator